MEQIEVDLVVDGIIFQKDPYGGIARIFRETLPRLCNLDAYLSITIFTDGPVQAELPIHPNIVHRRLPEVRPTLRPRGLMRRLLYPWRRILGSSWDQVRTRWLDDLNSGIWHSTFYSLPGKWKGPQVVTVYDLIPEIYPQYYQDPLDELGRQRKRRCILDAQQIVCISQTTRNLVEAWYAIPSDQIEVVYPAHSHRFRILQEGAAQFPGAPDAPFLLYVGARAGYKNFSTLLEAYASWVKRDEVLLVCAGTAWTHAEIRQIRESGLDTRVCLLENLDDDQLCRLYNRASGLIYPSLDEGFGIPLLEAMACGCQIAASRIPSTLEVAQDIPIYFDPKDVNSLRAALDRIPIIEQSQIMKTTDVRIDAGLRRSQFFSWEMTARGMLGVYRSVLGEGSPSERK